MLTGSSELLDFIYIRSKVTINLLRSSEPGAYLNYIFMEWIQFTYIYNLQIHQNTKNVFTVRWKTFFSNYNLFFPANCWWNHFLTPFRVHHCERKLKIKMMVHIYTNSVLGLAKILCRSKAEGNHLHIINHPIVR